MFNDNNNLNCIQYPSILLIYATFFVNLLEKLILKIIIIHIFFFITDYSQFRCIYKTL